MMKPKTLPFGGKNITIIGRTKYVMKNVISNTGEELQLSKGSFETDDSYFTEFKNKK